MTPGITVHRLTAYQDQRFFFFSSRRRHTRCSRDWSSDVCSSDLQAAQGSWSDPQGSQPAIVALAVLSMLAHGDDPNSGPYSRPIRRGLDFILGQQKDRKSVV